MLALANPRKLMTPFKEKMELLEEKRALKLLGLPSLMPADLKTKVAFYMIGGVEDLK